MGDGRLGNKSRFIKCRIHQHLLTFFKKGPRLTRTCVVLGTEILLRGIFVFGFQCWGQRVLLNLLHPEKYSVVVNALIVKRQYPLRKLTLRYRFPEISQKDVINFMRNIESNFAETEETEEIKRAQVFSVFFGRPH